METALPTPNGTIDAAITAGPSHCKRMKLVRGSDEEVKRHLLAQRSELGDASVHGVDHFKKSGGVSSFDDGLKTFADSHSAFQDLSHFFERGQASFLQAHVKGVSY